MVRTGIKVICKISWFSNFWIELAGKKVQAPRMKTRIQLMKRMKGHEGNNTPIFKNVRDFVSVQIGMLSRLEQCVRSSRNLSIETVYVSVVIFLFAPVNIPHEMRAPGH